MPYSDPSKQRKRQHSELPQDLPSKRQKTNQYWDNLSKLWLTKHALAELDRRNALEEQDCLDPQPIHQPLTRARYAKLTEQSKPTRDALLNFLPETIKSIKQFARAGGPDLSDLRDYPGPRYQPIMSQNRSIPHGRKRPAKSPPSGSRATKTTTRTTKSSVYSRNFEQKLVDNGFYPPGHRYPGGEKVPIPDNWAELNDIMARPRASLSPSEFTEDQFSEYQDADMNLSKENPLTIAVIPILEGKTSDKKSIGGGYSFRNLASLIKPKPKDKQADAGQADDSQADDGQADGKKAGDTPLLTCVTPDRFYGARPEQLNPKIRDTLSDIIIPSTEDKLPILPNFFLEAKGPNGTIAVATRQALHDGAIGTRGMHMLRSYLQKEEIYGNLAYTISSIYCAGTLRLYAHHIIPSTKNNMESETIMTHLKAYAIISDHETFLRGATAYRNLRDWAEEQRNKFIEDANERYLKSQSESQSTAKSGQGNETTSRLTITEDGETSFESNETEFHDAVARSFLDVEEAPYPDNDPTGNSKGKSRDT
ncbi:hypothetical protein FQN57_003146 [Myotisia sp. PD_48]|nr:hypothetical protein FQN57_003146 [Myotisia sp. PD_48]